MHNNIMAAGSRDRPPMLATGRYAQWRSRFLRYIDTRPNGDALRKCILKGPYTPTIVTTPAVPATEDSPAVPEQTTVETVTNMTPENRAHFESEKEAIHLILSLVATAQTLQDPYYQTSKPHKSYAPTSKASLPTRSHATTRYKGKEIAKPITPPSESASEEDSDPEQAQKDKRTSRKTWLSFKVLQETLQNLPQQPKPPQTPETRMWILLQGGQVVQQSGIQCFNYKEFGHYAKECRKPKRVNDSMYHKVPNSDSGTDAEPLEQVQYDTDDNVFANDIQHFDQSESISTTCTVETDYSNVTPDSPDMCDNDIQDDQNDVECDDERVALANLKLDVDENKKIQKQLKKVNATLTQELTE
ncbi:integrase, catalytic region, zinc finger, CCHC-type containing protein [Tanacetum coccineum]